MDGSPTEQDGRLALREHVAGTARRARDLYGPAIDAETMLRLLEDRSIVRFPVALRFGAEGLRAGEPALPEQVGQRPSEGYSLCLHPALEARPELWPVVIAYYIPSINYGQMATREEAELFGATLLGRDMETYYQAMCEIADSLPDPPATSGDLT